MKPSLDAAVKLDQGLTKGRHILVTRNVSNQRLDIVKTFHTGAFTCISEPSNKRVQLSVCKRDIFGLEPVKAPPESFLDRILNFFVSAVNEGLGLCSVDLKNIPCN